MDHAAAQAGPGHPRRDRPSLRNVFRRHARAVVVVAAVVTLGVGAGLVLGLSGPGSPPWCGPLLAELRVTKQRPSSGSLVAAVRRIQREDHAPVGRLVAAYLAAERSGNSYAAIDNVAAALQSVNRACGQPPGAYLDDVF